VISVAPGTSKSWLTGRTAGRIGVDVGTRMLKFAQCRLTFGIWKVTAVHVLPVAANQLADAAGLSRGLVGESIAGLKLQSMGFKGTSAITALSSAVVTPRLLDLPDGDDDDLAEMVREESDAPATSNVDFWRTRPVQRGKNHMAHVNAVVLPEQPAEGCVVGLEQAGLCCDAISVQSIAMARAVELMAPGDQPVAAIDWGATSPLICICRNGQAEYSRVLRNCGLKSAVDAISADLGISELEVAQLLVSFGIDSSRNGGGVVGARIDALLAEHVQRFQQEVTRTIEFIQQNQPDSVPEWLCLFGGGGTIAGIAPHLTEHLRIETRSWELEPGQLDSRIRSLEFQSLFGVAVGLSTLEADV
jgi:Tfp pilus assembly PilM family ATPase